MSNKSINKGKRERKYKLHKAVWKGDLEKVNGYLAKKCDVNEKDLHGNTPLHIAAHFANKDISMKQTFFNIHNKKITLFQLMHFSLTEQTRSFSVYLVGEQ